MRMTALTTFSECRLRWGMGHVTSPIFTRFAKLSRPMDRSVYCRWNLGSGSQGVEQDGLRNKLAFLCAEAAPMGI